MSTPSSTLTASECSVNMSFFINGLDDNPCAAALLQAFGRLGIPIKQAAMTMLRRGVLLEYLEVHAKNIANGVVKGGFSIIPDPRHPKVQQAKDTIRKVLEECKAGSPRCGETAGSSWFLIVFLLVLMVALAVFGMWLLKKGAEGESVPLSYITGDDHDSDEDSEHDDFASPQSGEPVLLPEQANDMDDQAVKRRTTTSSAGDYDLSISLDETFIKQ